MARRTALYSWTARLPVEQTDGMDVWEGWRSPPGMDYAVALETARKQLILALGAEYAADRAQYVVLA